MTKEEKKDIGLGIVLAIGIGLIVFLITYASTTLSVSEQASKCVEVANNGYKTYFTEYADGILIQPECYVIGEDGRLHSLDEVYASLIDLEKTRGTQ